MEPRWVASGRRDAVREAAALGEPVYVVEDAKGLPALVPASDRRMGDERPMVLRADPCGRIERFP